MAIFCGFDCLEIIFLHTRDFVVNFYLELEMSIISVLHDPIAGILNGFDIKFGVLIYHFCKMQLKN